MSQVWLYNEFDGTIINLTIIVNLEIPVRMIVETSKLLEATISEWGIGFNSIIVNLMIIKTFPMEFEASLAHYFHQTTYMDMMYMKRQINMCLLLLDFF